MEAVFLKVLNMSLSAAAVTVAVLLARLLLRRAPKKWSYLLWLVVAFRLVCPVSFSAPFSLLRLTAQSAAVTRSGSAASELTYIPQDIGYMAQPRVNVGTPAVSEAISGALPAAAPMDSANPMQIWIALGTALWCVGTAALLLYGAISYVNLRRRLRGAVRVEDGVYETDAVRAPFILGLFAPTVYLPVGLEGEPMHYVLAHERFHIRHGDHAVKLLAFLLLCVHWFDPLIWLAFCLMCRDMEMRCDEAVLALESGITKPYSMALLAFATERRFPSPSPLCFGETGVKERIKNVLRWKKPRAWVSVCAALLCVVAVAACAANPNKTESTSEPTGTPWDWTSTVQLSAVKGFAEGRGITLSHSQMKELISLLNAVRPEEIVRGRGIPSSDTLDITTGIGYRLRWGGGIIELDFDDAAAAAELYGPGVWEIHNEGLYAFLGALWNVEPSGKANAAPATATDLTDSGDETDWGEGFSADGHMFVRRYAVEGWDICIPVSGWTLLEASETLTKWVSDSGTGSTLTVRRVTAEEYAAERPQLSDGQSERFVPASDGGYWLVFTQYDPMIRIYSSWVVSEPELLERMAESFRSAGAAPVPETPAPTAAPVERFMPVFRSAEGKELRLNMSLIELNEQLSTELAPGYIYTLPQHALSVAAAEDGQAFRPVVELSFYEGWEISEGPGIGARVDEVKAWWGEPAYETDPEAFNPAKLYSLSYQLPDGVLEFVHRGDGVIQTIQLFAAELLEDPEGKSAPTKGSVTYWHGQGDARIEPFSCFGEVNMRCSAWSGDEHYRMAVTASDGTETVLLEGEGFGEDTIPAPRIENGALEVEFSGGKGGWCMQVFWFPQNGG